MLNWKIVLGKEGGGNKNDDSHSKARNDRLLSLNSVDVFEDTFSITDDRYDRVGWIETSG